MAAGVTALKNAWDKTCLMIVVALSCEATRLAGWPKNRLSLLPAQRSIPTLHTENRISSTYPFSQSTCLKVRDLATEVELELAGGP